MYGKRIIRKNIRREIAMAIQTERLLLSALSNDEIRHLIQEERDSEMKVAYEEMLSGCLQNPKDREWYAPWKMELNSNLGIMIGDICFKGLQADGSVEIGYGIHPEYEGKGYTTEAVKAMIQWAFKNENVMRIEAETVADNIASQRILEKNGFKPNGIEGEEGPRFQLNK